MLPVRGSRLYRLGFHDLTSVASWMIDVEGRERGSGSVMLPCGESEWDLERGLPTDRFPPPSLPCFTVSLCLCYLSCCRFLRGDMCGSITGTSCHEVMSRQTMLRHTVSVSAQTVSCGDSQMRNRGSDRSSETGSATNNKQMQSLSA
jgi:hypothetical protein